MVVIIVGMIAVLQRLGVQTTSIIAVLGAASLAVGLALQGTLTNVASGIMLLILRPYKVGDVVDRDGTYYRAKVAHGAAYAGTWGPPLPSVWDVVGPVA